MSKVCGCTDITICAKCSKDYHVIEDKVHLDTAVTKTIVYKVSWYTLTNTGGVLNPTKEKYHSQYYAVKGAAQYKEKQIIEAAKIIGLTIFPIISEVEVL